MLFLVQVKDPSFKNDLPELWYIKCQSDISGLNMFENRTDFKLIIIKIIKKDVLKIPPVPKRQLLYYYEILA